jgi:hypothetical protein
MYYRVIQNERKKNHIYIEVANEVTIKLFCQMLGEISKLCLTNKDIKVFLRAANESSRIYISTAE